MALEEQTISVRFSGGVETKQDAKGVAHTKLLALENGVFTKGISIKKRNGYDPLSSIVLGGGAFPATHRALAARGSDLLHFSDNEAHAFVAGADQWKDIDDVLSVGLSHRPMAKISSNQTAADYDSNGGIGVYAWQDSRGGVYYSIVDAATNKTLVRPTSMAANGSRPYVCAVGSVLHVYCADGTDGWIWLLVIDPTHPTATVTPKILIEGVLKSRPAFSVAIAKLNTGTSGHSAAHTVMAWQRDDGNIGLCHITMGGNVGSPLYSAPSPVTIVETSVVAVGPIVALDKVAWITTADTSFPPIVVLWIAPAPGPAGLFQYRTFRRSLVLVDSGTLANAASGTTAIAAAFQANNTSGSRRRLHVFASAPTGPVYWDYIEPSYAGGGYPEANSAVASPLAYGVGLATNAFRDEGTLASTIIDSADGEHVYVGLGYGSTLYNTRLLMRDDGKIVARFLSGTSGSAVANDHLPVPKTGETPAGDRTATLATIYRSALESENGDVFTEDGIRLVEFDFAATQSHQTAQLGDSLYLAGGGFLQCYDGDSFLELFHWAIDDAAAPAQSNSTGTVGNGTYYYRFSLEYVMSNGEVMRGPVSAGTKVVVAGSNDTITWEIPTYRVTRMTSPRGEVRIGVWRTEANADLYYRISSLNPTATGNNGYVANDPTTATVAFVDGMPDATLLTKEPLYTNGGILNNDPTECGSLLVAGKNRLWTNDPTDPLLLHYSQELAAGYAVEFSPLLTIKFDPTGGPITALAVMDDTVVVFKETAIFAFAGPGPLANPDAGGGFSPPQLIPSGVGCRDRRSVAVTPAGVLFQSNKGIWLIDRGRNVTYVGSPVELYSQQVITSAEVLDDRHEVRLLTSAGLTLVWDYLFDQWSTFTNHEGLDAQIVDGVYHYLRNDGGVWQETDGEYGDAERPIVFALETAWIKLRDVLQGFQMVWNLELLGEWVSDHSLKVFIQYDYEPGWYGEPWLIEPMAEDVVWQGEVNASIVGKTLVKDGGADGAWNAGASSQQLLNGNGFMEFTAEWGNAPPVSAIGLSNGDPGQTKDEIDFGFSLSAVADAGQYQVIENGTGRTTLAFYSDGTVFRVEVIDSIVYYLVDGAIVWTSTVTPTFPLLVDAALSTLTNYFSSVVICQYDAQEYGGGVYGGVYGSPHGGGTFGGAYGTHGYQFKLHVAEECEAFRVRFEFHDMRGLFGACAELSEMLVHCAVTGPRKTLGDSRSY